MRIWDLKFVTDAWNVSTQKKLNETMTKDAKDLRRTSALKCNDNGVKTIIFQIQMELFVYFWSFCCWTRTQQGENTNQTREIVSRDEWWWWCLYVLLLLMMMIANKHTIISLSQFNGEGASMRYCKEMVDSMDIEQDEHEPKPKQDNIRHDIIIKWPNPIRNRSCF